MNVGRLVEEPRGKDRAAVDRDGVDVLILRVGKGIFAVRDIKCGCVAPRQTNAAWILDGRVFLKAGK